MAHEVKLPYPPPYQTIDVLARHLTITPATVDRWVKDSLLPPPCPRKSEKGVRLWKWETVCRWLDGTTAEPNDQPDLDPFVEGAKRAALERERRGRLRRRLNPKTPA
jgi:hypothetical protein